MSIDTGGPAFPVTITVLGQTSTSGGMTLRDYFAAQVLQGAVTDERFDEHDSLLPINIALFCYKIADAMIAAREAADEPTSQ